MIEGRAECVITGCSLLVCGTWVNGDLFKMGDTYIFNGNANASGHPQWQTKDMAGNHQYSKTVNITARESWERKGVFVFHETQCQFNKAALEYMEGV